MTSLTTILILFTPLIICLHNIQRIESQNNSFSFIDENLILHSKLLQDYIYTLKNNLQWTEKNVILRIYMSSDSNAIAGMIVQNFWNLTDKRSMLISTTHGNFITQSVSEKIAIAVATNERDLKRVLNLLYNRSQHDYGIVCVAYLIQDVVQNLTLVTSEIWKKGLSRNVFFIAMSASHNAVVILRAPSYRSGYCDEGSLVEVGYVKDQNYTVIRENYLPVYDNLGGCELNIMVIPAFSPYIERRSSSPGGIVGLLVTELAKYLNFTPKFKWAYNREMPLKHYKSNNLNILFDLLPRTVIPLHKYSFNFGLTKSAFVVPRSKYYSDSTNLVNPFDYLIWVYLTAAMLALTAVTYLKSKYDFVYILLKAYGVLLGISGQIPNSPWMKCIFWLWLLPAFILQQSYLATLVKNMAVTEPKGEINTIKQLLDSDLSIVCTSDMRLHFCRSISTEHMEFLYLCLLCREVDDSYIFKQLYPAAILGKMINNTSFVANEEVIKFAKGHRHVRFVHGSFVSIPQTVSVRPGNPYIFHIYKIYTRCIESGLFEHWKRTRTPVFKIKKNVTFVQIINDKIQKCYVIILIGWTVSALVFFMEIAVHRLVTKKKQ